MLIYIYLYMCVGGGVNHHKYLYDVGKPSEIYIFAIFYSSLDIWSVLLTVSFWLSLHMRFNMIIYYRHQDKIILYVELLFYLAIQK